jgi:hypothetical protein
MGMKKHVKTSKNMDKNLYRSIRKKFMKIGTKNRQNIYIAVNFA